MNWEYGFGDDPVAWTIRGDSAEVHADATHLTVKATEGSGYGEQTATAYIPLDVVCELQRRAKLAAAPVERTAEELPSGWEWVENVPVPGWRAKGGHVDVYCIGGEVWMTHEGGCDASAPISVVQAVIERNKK